MLMTVEQMRVAMDSPAKLKEWLVESGRRFLIFDAVDLVDALEWPREVETLQSLITSYREHRQTIASGRTETQMNPETGDPVEVTVQKSDGLEDDEKEALIEILSKELHESS